MKRHRKFNDHWIALTEYQEVEQEGKENLVITPAFPTYEKKIELMDWLPVTSLMTNPEMSEFMNYFQAFFANKYQLTDPRLQGIEL